MAHTSTTLPIVRELMTSEVYAVSPDTSIETTARLFASKNISGAPVVDGEGKLVGVVSRSDLVDPDLSAGEREGVPMYFRISEGWAEALGDALDTGAGRVAEVMTPATICIEASADIIEASQKMLAEGIHRLIVLQDSDFVGVVSAVDIVRGYLAHHAPKAPESRAALGLPTIQIVA